MRKSLGVMGLGLGVVVLSGCLGSNDKLGEGFEGDFTEVGESESGVEVTLNRVGYVELGTSGFEEDLKNLDDYDYYMVADVTVDNQSGEKKIIEGMRFNQEEYPVGNFILRGSYAGYEDSDASEHPEDEERNFWEDEYRAISPDESLLDGESVRGIAVFGVKDIEEYVDGEEYDLMYELDRGSSKEFEVDISGVSYVWEVTESDREWDGDYLSRESKWNDKDVYESVDFGDLKEGIVGSVQEDKQINDGTSDVDVSVREAVYFENVEEGFFEDIRNAGSLSRGERVLVVNVDIENNGDEAVDLRRFEIRKGYEELYEEELVEDVEINPEVEEGTRENVIVLSRGVNEGNVGEDVLDRYRLIPFNTSEDGLLDPGKSVSGNILFVSERIESDTSYYLFYGTDQGVNKETDEDDEPNGNEKGRESIRINVVE